MCVCMKKFKWIFLHRTARNENRNMSVYAYVWIFIPNGGVYNVYFQFCFFIWFSILILPFVHWIDVFWFFHMSIFRSFSRPIFFLFLILAPSPCRTYAVSMRRFDFVSLLVKNIFFAHRFFCMILHKFIVKQLFLIDVQCNKREISFEKPSILSMSFEF